MNRKIARIQAIILTILSRFPVNNNPIELRIGSLLRESEWVLRQLEQELHSRPLNKEHLKYYLSILFREDDALEPLVHAWIRASAWMENASPEDLQLRKKQYDSIKQELKDIVPDIEEVFGKEEMRYIVPPLYRSEKEV